MQLHFVIASMPQTRGCSNKFNRENNTHSLINYNLTIISDKLLQISDPAIMPNKNKNKKPTAGGTKQSRSAWPPKKSDAPRAASYTDMAQARAKARNAAFGGEAGVNQEEQAMEKEVKKEVLSEAEKESAALTKEGTGLSDKSRSSL